MFLFISDDKVMLTTIKPKFQLDIFGSFQNAFSDFFQEKKKFYVKSVCGFKILLRINWNHKFTVQLILFQDQQYIKIFFVCKYWSHFSRKKYLKIPVY